MQRILVISRNQLHILGHEFWIASDGLGLGDSPVASIELYFRCGKQHESNTTSRHCGTNGMRMAVSKIQPIHGLEGIQYDLGSIAFPVDKSRFE